MNALKEEVETVNKKLAELTDEELKNISGGVVAAYDGYSSVLGPIICPGCDNYTATYYYRNIKCVKIILYELTVYLCLWMIKLNRMIII